MLPASLCPRFAGVLSIDAGQTDEQLGRSHVGGATVRDKKEIISG